MEIIKNKKIWIFGSGGIGSKLVIKLASEKSNRIKLFSTRSKKDLEQDINQELNNTNNIDIAKINNYSDNEIADIINHYNLPDIIIVTCGVLYNQSYQPEKTIQNMSADWLLDSVNYNVLPSLFIAKYVTKKLKKSDSVKLICFSARVGSISDNKLGGWHSYRMSKAMLNMLVKNIAIEWKIKSPNSIVIAYHPGTVDTNLSKPFTTNYDPKKLFTREEAANYLEQVVVSLKLEDSGSLKDWQGVTVEP